MTTTKTIGPSGADYATPALWFASFAATLTDDQVGNFQNAEVTVTASQALSGVTAGAHTILMTAGTGNSFADNANKLTNALAYNAANGAALRQTAGGGSALDITCDNFSVTRLQIKQDANYGAAVIFQSGGTGRVVDQCILCLGAASSGNTLTLAGGTTVTNVLVQTTANTDNGVRNAGGNNDYKDVTIVTSSAGTGATGFTQVYGAPTLKNVAVAGYATDFSGTAGTCANNATDKSSFGGTNYGTTGQVSLVQATEFQNASAGTEDYRVKSLTSVKLKGNGTATGTPSTDIVGSTRAAPPTIGSWDVGAAGGAVSPVMFNGFP
jgi:hypothetical protein